MVQLWLSFYYYRIIKKNERQFEYLEENTEKYKTFSAPIEKKVTEVDRDGSKSIVTKSYKIKLIDSTRFMVSSLSNFVDKLEEGIHRTKY